MSVSAQIEDHIQLRQDRRNRNEGLNRMVLQVLEYVVSTTPRDSWLRRLCLAEPWLMRKAVLIAVRAQLELHAHKALRLMTAPERSRNYDGLTSRGIQNVLATLTAMFAGPKSCSGCSLVGDSTAENLCEHCVWLQQVATAVAEVAE